MRNDSSFMPSFRVEHMQEWVRFVSVSGALTDWSTNGSTMDEAMVALRSRVDCPDLRVLEGLAELKKNQDQQPCKIYDPFCRDHFSLRVVSEFNMLFACDDCAGVWFLAVASVMRPNWDLVASHVDLWRARTQSAAKAVLQRCVDKNSMSPLEITNLEVHKQELLHMWEDSRNLQWLEKAEQCVMKLVEGTSFRQAIKDWNPMRRPSPTVSTSPEHFRAYFVGKLLHRANNKCTYAEVPGGSLIRQRTSTGKVLLSDLIHDEDTGVGDLSVAHRCRWWSGVAHRFRHVADNKYPGLFPEMEDSEIEYGACEFVRMCRRLYNIGDKRSSLMLPSILQIFESAASELVPDAE